MFQTDESVAMATLNKCNHLHQDTEDLSYSDLDVFPEFLLDRKEKLVSLQLDHNTISVLPRCVSLFSSLVTLDLSNNHLSYISPEMAHLQQLRTFIARNNRLQNDSIPKEFAVIQSLEVVNVSGNRLSELPIQFTALNNLKCLYIGANNLRSIPGEIANLKRLEVLYIGGNKLESIPYEVGSLKHLVSLILCDNKLTSLPDSLVNLRNLQSLSLHNNRLSTLPPEIVSLQLVELSLRNNPLVVKFVQDMAFQPPSLLELSGRVIKVKSVPYSEEDLPRSLIDYLQSASCCVNPKCKGVYFTSRVEHVKFVDFCGKYRLPLLEYLCSPVCKDSPFWESTSESESEEELAPMVSKMKKVLLPQGDETC